MKCAGVVQLALVAMASVVAPVLAADRPETSAIDDPWAQYVVKSVQPPKPAVDKGRRGLNLRLMAVEVDPDPVQPAEPLIAVWYRLLPAQKSQDRRDQIIVVRSDFEGTRSTELARIEHTSARSYPRILSVAVAGDDVFLAVYGRGLWRLSGNRIVVFGEMQGSLSDFFSQVAAVKGELLATVAAKESYNRPELLVRFDPESEEFTTLVSAKQPGTMQVEPADVMHLGSIVPHPERRELYFAVRTRSEIAGQPTVNRPGFARVQPGIRVNRGNRRWNSRSVNVATEPG